MTSKISKGDMRFITVNSLLGFMSGLPLLLVSNTLQAWYTDQGVNLTSVGALSLIGLPYSFKFLWAPLLDSYGFSSDAPRRFWILMSQCCIFFGILVMAYMNPSSMPMEMACIAMLVAFFSATQDSAIDAYRQVVTPAKLRSTIVGCATTAYRLAMICSGGFALVIADKLGWTVTYEIMAFFVMVGFFLTWSLVKPYEEISLSLGCKDMIVLPMKKLLQIKNIKTIFALLILYKIGDAFLMNLLMSFLLKGLNYSKSDVGYLLKVFGLAATILGTFFATYHINRNSFHKSLLFFAILQLISSSLFILLAYFKWPYFVIIAVFAESFSAGASSCTLVVMFMNICNEKRFAASQIAFMSALSSLPRVIIGPVAGYIAMQYGWVDFFIVATLLAIPSIILLRQDIGGKIVNDNGLKQSLATNE
ncbi:MAG: MFS transporter [Pseudomonadota bacterium]|nr:MFS transporter [Pseudomonadota bacterium]